MLFQIRISSNNFTKPKVKKVYSRVGQSPHEWICNELNECLRGKHYSDFEIFFNKFLVFPKKLYIYTRLFINDCSYFSSAVRVVVLLVDATTLSASSLVMLSYSQSEKLLIIQSGGSVVVIGVV